jgi:hypothetical protein
MRTAFFATSCSYVSDEHHPSAPDEVEERLHVSVLFKLATDIIAARFVLDVTDEERAAGPLAVHAVADERLMGAFLPSRGRCCRWGHVS